MDLQVLERFYLHKNKQIIYGIKGTWMKDIDQCTMFLETSK